MIRSLRRMPLFVGLALLAAGCATVPGSPSSSGVWGTTSEDKPASAGAQADATPAPTRVDAPVASNANPAAARYALPGMNGNTTSLGSVIVTNPLAPRTVDLTLRPDDIWERIRTGFGIPNIESPVVAEQQAWYLAHPDSLRRAVNRSRWFRDGSQPGIGSRIHSRSRTSRYPCVVARVEVTPSPLVAASRIFSSVVTVAVAAA